MEYADSPAAWDKVARVVDKARRAGFDTETYGHDVRKSSAPHRARVHVWSLAVSTDIKHPRGFRRAKGLMLPAAALDYRPIIEVLENPEIIKVAHNMPHDAHAVGNHGIKLRGGLDTLPKARLILVDESSHSLKPLMERKLGRRVITYEDVVEEPNDVVVVKKKTHKACICGATPCKRRGPQHVRVRWKTFTPKIEIRGTRDIPLQTIVPGHPRFPLLTRYAIQDAEGVLELDDFLVREEVYVLRKRGEVPVPWAA